jgi:transposase
MPRKGALPSPSEPQFCRLNELMKINYAVTRAYLLEESFQQFWQYKSAGWAGKFLRLWFKDAIWSRLQPFAKLAATPREHQASARTRRKPRRIDATIAHGPNS